MGCAGVRGGFKEKEPANLGVPAWLAQRGDRGERLRHGEGGSHRDSCGIPARVEFLEGGGVLGGRPVDLAGLEWSTGSGSRRCGKEQSCGRHGGEDGAARWGRDVSGGGKRVFGLSGALGWLRRCALGWTERSRGGLGQRRRGRAGLLSGRRSGPG